MSGLGVLLADLGVFCDARPGDLELFGADLGVLGADFGMFNDNAALEIFFADLGVVNSGPVAIDGDLGVFNAILGLVTSSLLFDSLRGILTVELGLTAADLGVIGADFDHPAGPDVELGSFFRVLILREKCTFEKRSVCIPLVVDLSHGSFESFSLSFDVLVLCMRAILTFLLAFFIYYRSQAHIDYQVNFYML